MPGVRSAQDENAIMHSAIASNGRDVDGKLSRVLEL